MKQSGLQSLMFKSVALLAQTPYVDTRQAALTALHSVLQVTLPLFIIMNTHVYCTSCCLAVSTITTGEHVSSLRRHQYCLCM
jgi:hypothetical protein